MKKACGESFADMRNDNKRAYYVFILTALIFLFLPKSHFSSSPLVEENPLHSVQRLREREFGNAGRFNNSETHFSRTTVATNLQSWIDVDLQPWNITGITKKMVDLGAQQGTMTGLAVVSTKVTGDCIYGSSVTSFSASIYIG